MSIDLVQISILVGVCVFCIVFGAYVSWLVMKKKQVKAIQEIEDRLREQIEKIKQEVAITEGRLITESEKAAQLQEEKKRLKQKIVAANGQLREFSDLRQHLEEEEKEKEALEKKLAELSEHMTEKDALIEDKEKSIAEITGERDSRLQELEQANQDLETARQEVLQTKEDLRHSQQEAAQTAQAFQGQIARLEEQVSKKVRPAPGSAQETPDELRAVINKYARKIAREMVKG